MIISSSCLLATIGLERNSAGKFRHGGLNKGRQKIFPPRFIKPEIITCSDGTFNQILADRNICSGSNLRLLLAFLIPNFTYDSYFNLRQVQHIHDTGLPLYNDPLSYGGRELVFLPFFHYLLAGFSFILPLELAAKILPNFFMALLTIIIFYLSKKITNNDSAALVSAFLVGILPVLFFTNDFSVDSVLTLDFLCHLLLSNLPQKKYSIFT